MSHQDIIQTLIEWIDEHIDQPLNIDVVARKSGYSKWYLQRMFRTVMHQTLGDYIRQRRLLLAAEAVISREIGSGVVPIDAGERAWRERHGTLMQDIARGADRVTRVFCGLAEVLK